MRRTEDELIRRTRRVVLATVALLACALVGCVILWRLHLSYEANERLRALQRAGLPASGAELNQWYASVPDSENAALVMTQAFALMRGFPDRRSNELSSFKPPPRGQPLLPEDRVLLTDYLALNAEALAKAREAITLPKSRYPVDFSPGKAALLPHLGELKRLALAASYGALLTLDSDSKEHDPASITTLLGLARTLDEEPMLLSQMVRAAILRIATTTLERSLVAGKWSDADLRTVGLTLAAAEKTNAMMRALIGERASAIPYFRMSRKEWDEIRRSDPTKEDADKELVESIAPGLLPRLAWVTGFFERDLGFYLAAMETNISLAGLPFPRDLAVCTNLAKQQQLDADRHNYFLSGLLLTDVDRILIRESDCAARLRTAQAALAVERFRLATDHLPKDLSELAPRWLSAVPLDPFDGAPLRYKPLVNGYVIYSIGPDGQDDGGQEPTIGRRSGQVPQDITFTVER